MPTDQKTRDWYEENAENYAAHTRNPNESIYHAYYEKPAMYSLLPDLKGKTVLSIGCGSGEDSHHLKQEGALKSVGIDLSKNLIRIASETYQDCEFKVMDMEKLDFPDSSFDFAYSSLAIHYIEDWTGVFKEVFRVLKPNSYFLFSCHHPLTYGLDKSQTDTHHISKIEITRDNITRERKVTGDYLTKRKNIDALGKGTVNTWNMSIGDISESLRVAGFLIDRIMEPRPIESMKEIDPTKYEVLNKIPYFIIFKLIKL